MGTMHRVRFSPHLEFRSGLGDSQAMPALSEIALSGLYHSSDAVLSVLCVLPCVWYWVSLLLHIAILKFVVSICFQKAQSITLSLRSAAMSDL